MNTKNLHLVTLADEGVTTMYGSYQTDRSARVLAVTNAFSRELRRSRLANRTGVNCAVLAERERYEGQGGLT